MFHLIWICCISATIGQEKVSDFEIWRSSAATLDNYRITFEFEAGPTQKTLRYIRNNPVPERQTDMITDIFSKRRGTLSIVQKGDQIKYDVEQDISSIKLPPSGLDVDFAAWKREQQYVQSHLRDSFRYLDVLDRTGSIRVGWPLQPDNVISAVKPPMGDWVITCLTSSIPTYEFRSKTERKALRFFLDITSGMMPSKVEYCDVLADGKLFVYRVLVVDRYDTRQGVYLPVISTIRDFANGTDKEWQVEKHFKLAKAELGANIPDGDFNVTFPPGTIVNDMIAGITYKVNNGTVDYVDPDQGHPNIDLGETEARSLKPSSNTGGRPQSDLPSEHGKLVTNLKESDNSSPSTHTVTTRRIGVVLFIVLVVVGLSTAKGLLSSRQKKMWKKKASS